MEMLQEGVGGAERASTGGAKPLPADVAERRRHFCDAALRHQRQIRPEPRRFQLHTEHRGPIADRLHTPSGLL